MTTMRETGSWAMLAGAVAAFIDSFFAYFWPGNGIHDSWGALLILVLSALILIGALLFAFDVFALHRLLPVLGILAWRWIRGAVAVLLLPGFLANGFASYMLEEYLLMGLMAFTFAGWLACFFGERQWRARAA